MDVLVHSMSASAGVSQPRRRFHCKSRISACRRLAYIALMQMRVATAPAYRAPISHWPAMGLPLPQPRLLLLIGGRAGNYRPNSLLLGASGADLAVITDPRPPARAGVVRGCALVAPSYIHARDYRDLQGEHQKGIRELRERTREPHAHQTRLIPGLRLRVSHDPSPNRRRVSANAAASNPQASRCWCAHIRARTPDRRGHCAPSRAGIFWCT